MHRRIHFSAPRHGRSVRVFEAHDLTADRGFGQQGHGQIGL
jgi:hypothetical protein